MVKRRLILDLSNQKWFKLKFFKNLKSLNIISPKISVLKFLVRQKTKTQLFYEISFLSSKLYYTQSSKTVRLDLMPLDYFKKAQLWRFNIPTMNA